MTEQSPIEVYRSLGWDLQEEGSQLVTDCPACGKRKMYVDPKRSVFDCKVCGISGNSSSVLEKMHVKVYKPALGADRRAILAKYRGLPESFFTLDEYLGYDAENDRFTWLVSKADGKPRGLRHVTIDLRGKKQPVKQLSGHQLGIIGIEEASIRKDDTIYLCEGEWDRIALINLLGELELPGTVLAVPGANNLPKDDIEHLKQRDVVVCYDNDEAGRNGAASVYKKLAKLARRLRFVCWPSSLKEGYDVHDLVKENLKSLTQAWSTLQASLKDKPDGLPEEDVKPTNSLEGEQASVTPIGAPALHETFHKWLHLTNTDLIDIVMGAMWAVHLPGEPLWMFVVAPPSCSKSETIVPASGWWRCQALSTLSPKSLVSGFQGKDGDDPSIMAQLEGRRSIIMIKDLTPLLQSHKEERDEAFGILRDAYDGSFSKSFGNGLRREYKDLHFGIVAGVTPAIDMMRDSAMGERFIKFRSDRETDRPDERQRMLRAMQNCGHEEQMRSELKAACIAALQRPFDKEKVPVADEQFLNIVMDLAQIVAVIRADSLKEKGSDCQLCVPVIESSARLSKQLIKLAQGIALHLELTSLSSPRIIDLIRRVALHTPDAITTRVIQALYYAPQAGATAGELLKYSHKISRDTMSDTLNRLCVTGTVSKYTDKKVDMVAFYRLNDEFRSMLTRTNFFSVPKHDPFHP